MTCSGRVKASRISKKPDSKKVLATFPDIPLNGKKMHTRPSGVVWKSAAIRRQVFPTAEGAALDSRAIAGLHSANVRSGVSAGSGRAGSCDGTGTCWDGAGWCTHRVKSVPMLKMINRLRKRIIPQAAGFYGKKSIPPYVLWERGSGSWKQR